MGCPAKKVCRKAAGSALLADEHLVARILTTVVDAVDVPVTLKIRTGTAPDQRNGVSIARIAEQAGISAELMHRVTALSVELCQRPVAMLDEELLTAAEHQKLMIFGRK